MSQPCVSMDGPLVTAAKNALAAGDVRDEVQRRFDHPMAHAALDGHGSE